LLQILFSWYPDQGKFWQLLAVSPLESYCIQAIHQAIHQDGQLPIVEFARQNISQELLQLSQKTITIPVSSGYN
jgi:hypothetical protein